VKRGNIVRRVKGWTPMRIVSTAIGDVTVMYCGQESEDHAIPYRWTDICLVIDPDAEFAKCPGWHSRLTDRDRQQLARQSGQKTITEQAQPKETTMTKLYQTKEETPRFGTLLATNSAGLLVLEMKGSGEVLAFETSAIEEVKPYTVCIQFLDGSGRDYQYLSRKGDVEVGDLILCSSGSPTIARVRKINTASDKATVTLRGVKLQTEAFGAADVDLTDDA